MNTLMLVPMYKFVYTYILHIYATFAYFAVLKEGQDYLSAMAAAANYAWVNR